MLFLCCLDLTIARSCYYSSSCGYYETCCSDKVCRRRCYSCSYDYQCGTGEKCCKSRCKTTCTRSCSYDYECGAGEECCNGLCKKDCTRSCLSSYQCDDGKSCCSGYCKTSCTDVGLIVGLVVGNILFFGAIIAIAAFFCCKSAPCYRHRHNGRVVAVAQVPAPPMQTTTTTRHISQVQHPTEVVNNPALPVGVHQPPPQYTPVANQSKSPPGMPTAVADN